MATIIGNDSNNWLVGSSGNDYIKGFGGDDTLKGGGGADQLFGGVGIDTALYADSWESVYVSLAQGYGSDGTAAGDTLFSIENVYGSSYDDVLIGDGGRNTLVGLDGSDALEGGGGDDMLDGGYGGDSLMGGAGADVLDGGYDNDVLYSGAGADVLIGGAGDRDEAYYGHSPGGVHVSLMDNFGLFNDADGDVFSGIEGLGGSFYDDTLIGDDGANYLSGWAGADVLNGHGGRDSIWGGPGTDTMIGGTGDDHYQVEDGTDIIVEFGGQGFDQVGASVSYVLTPGADVEVLYAQNSFGAPLDLTGNAANNVIYGNNANNVINGGDGRDELTGGAGQDSFLFNTPLNPVVNLDVITDFNVADDTILLDDAIFSSNLGLGNISSGEFVIGAAAQDANDRIIYNSGTGALSYDSDGNGGIAQVQFARLSTGLALTYLDFYVV